MRAAELEVVVTADASQATGELSTMDDALGRIGKLAVGETLKNWGADALGFAKDFIVSGADFAREMAFVDKLTGDSGQYFQALQDKALQMGEKTVFSAQEAAQGMEQLAREGFTPAQIIGTNAFNSMIDGAANMAAALRINLDDAANILGMTMRSYADTSLSAAQATDILTQASLRSGKTADEFNNQLKFVLATADQLHIPLEQVAAATGELMSQNVPNAGAGLRAFLVGVTTDGTKAFGAISSLGINARDALAKGGLPELINEIDTAMKNLSPDEQSALIKDMSGGNRQVSALIQLLRDGSGGLADFTNKMHSLGPAASVMAALVDTTAGSFHILQSSIFTAEKVLGDAVDGYIKPFVDGLTAVVNAFIAAPPAVHLFAAALIILGGIAMTLAGGLLIGLALGIGNIMAAAALGIAAVAGIVAVFGLLAAGLVLLKPQIDTFVSSFKSMLSEGINPVAAALLSLELTFPSLGGVIDSILPKLTTFRQSFETATMLGMNPFDAALEALRFTFPSLLPMFDAFRAAGDRLIAAYGQDGLRGVLLALPGAIKLVADGLVQGGILLAPVAVRVAKWAVSEVASGVESLAGTVAKFVADNWKNIKDAGFDAVGYAIRLGKWALKETDKLFDAVQKWVASAWPTIRDFGFDAAGYAIRLGKWALRTVDNLFDAVQKWVSSAWGTIKDAGFDAVGYAVRLGKWALKETDKLSDAITKWVKDNVTKANLSDIGKTIGDQVASAINAINWGSVGQTFGYGLGTALAAGVKLVGALLVVAFNALKDGQLVNALTNLATSLVTGFAKGFSDAIKNQFPGVASAVDGAVKQITDAFNKLPAPVRKVIDDFGKMVGDLGKPAVALGLAAIGISLAFSAIAAAATAVAAPLIAAGAAAIAAAPEILIIALAALAAYEAFKHWDAISGFVTKFGDAAAASAVGVTALAVALGLLNPALGALILVAVGIGLVVAHFDELKSAVAKLGDAISAAWQWIDKIAHIAWGKISGSDAFVASLNAVSAALDGLAAAYGAASAALGWISSHVGGGGPAAGSMTASQAPNAQVGDYIRNTNTPGGLNPEFGPGGAGGGIGGYNPGFNADPRANDNRFAQSQYANLGGAGSNFNSAFGVFGGTPGIPDPGGGHAVDYRGTGGSQAGGAAAFQQMTAQVTGQANALTGQLGAAGQAAGQAWARGLGAGLQTGLSAVTAVVGAVTAIASGLSGRLAAAGTASGQGWARSLGAGLQTGLTAVSAVTNAINTIVSSLTGRLTADGTTSGQGWARGLGAGLQLGLTAAVAVTAAVSAIFAAWGARTVAVGQTTGQQFAAAWGQGLQLALTATVAVAAAIQTTISTMANTVSATVNSMAGRVAGGFTAMRSAAVGTANGMASSVTGAVSGMANSVSSTVNSMAGRVAGGFQAMRSAAVSAAQSMMSEVTGAINAGAGAAAGAAYNAGASIGAGLANGMYSQLGAVQAAAAALANAAAAAANTTLRNSSPSKVFHQIGLYAGQGFANGIRESLAGAANAVRDGVGPAIAAVEGAMNQALARPGATIAAGRGGSTVVYVTNNNTVRVDDLPDVIRAAQFVRDSDSVRQLVMGTT